MSKRSNDPKNSKRAVCYCNNVSKDTIEAAIKRGCHNLNLIFDATSAGVGPCGGSCRTALARMLESYLQTGQFPEVPRPAGEKKLRPSD